MKIDSSRKDYPILHAFIDQDVASIQLADTGNKFWHSGSWEDNWNNYTHMNVGIAEIKLNSGSNEEATALLTVNPVNDAPILIGSQAVLANGKEDVTYTIQTKDLLQGYNDIDGDPLSISNLSASDTRHKIKDNGNGSWTLTPAENFNGKVDLSYNVIDGNGGEVTDNNSFVFAATNDGDAIFSINGRAAIGQTLSITENIADPDGNGQLSYSWQSSSNGSSWSQIGTSATYKVTETDEGKKIRSVISYTDNQEFVEEVITKARDMPINNGDATFSINGTAAIGETLSITEDSADPDGAGSPSYAWFTSADGSYWTQVSTNQSYSPLSIDAEKLITASVFYTDGDGFLEEITTPTVTIASNGNTGNSTSITNVSSSTQTNTDITININLGDVNLKTFDIESISNINHLDFTTLENNYNKFDWESVNYTELNTSSKTAIDWEEVDFKKAAKSSSFSLDVVDWSEVNTSTKSKSKKIYNSIDWSSESISSTVAQNLDYSLINFNKFDPSNLSDINDLAFDTLGNNNKKFDWSSVDYSELNSTSISKIDWSQVDFKKANTSSTFYAEFENVDFSEVNAATTSKTKKVYKDIDWEKVDYSELFVGEADTIDAIDWAQVDYKEATKADDFDIEVVDFSEVNASNKAKAIYKTFTDAHFEQVSDEVDILTGLSTSGNLSKTQQTKVDSLISSAQESSALIAPESSPQIDLPDILDPLLGNITSQEIKQEPFDVVDTLIAADPFA